MPYGQPLPKTPGPDARRSATPAAGGRGAPEAASGDARAAARLRRELWAFASRTRLVGARRDQAARALARTRYPKAARQFSDAQLVAVLREPQDGRCSSDALRALCAAGDEPMPEQPTPGLLALLGKPCGRCEVRFTESESVEFERRVLAAGGSRRRAPDAQLLPAESAPSPGRVGPCPTVTAAAAPTSSPPGRSTGQPRPRPRTRPCNRRRRPSSRPGGRHPPSPARPVEAHYCRHCGASGPGKDPPAGWYRLLRRNPEQREHWRAHQTLGLFCSVPCLAAWATTASEKEAAR